MRRGKPFLIRTVIQTYRYEGDEKDFAKRAEARRQEIAALLMRVLKTLAFIGNTQNQK
jgi:hypothetical protein